MNAMKRLLGNGRSIDCFSGVKLAFWALAFLGVCALPVRADWVQATGGTVSEINGYRVHTFTSDGTFEMISGGDVEVLIVGGGGGGGGGAGGGGGGGGVLFKSLTLDPGSTTVTVGAGGAAGSSNGADSTFGSWTAIGGGKGGNVRNKGGDGGSGGGGGGFGGETYPAAPELPARDMTAAQTTP